MSYSHDIKNRQYLDILPVGICIISSNLEISMWNEKLENWTGINAESVLNESLSDVAPAFSDPLIMERLKMAFAGGGPVILSYRFHPHMFPFPLEHQNEGRYQRTTIIPFDLSDEETNAMIVVEDVSLITDQVQSYRRIQKLIVNELEERKRAEKSLAVANNKLNTLSAINRHDLQNLLMALDGYLTFSLQKNPNDDVRHYLDKMKKVTDVMKKQVQFTRDYQDMGIQAPEWFNVYDLAYSSLGGIAYRGVDLVCDTKQLKILADPLIQKAIYNLMENAVRHGVHTTRITISSDIRGDELILIIQDNGNGVPDNIKNRIFERGFGSNTGLGLFLTKEILAITGISILENGREGEGARFELHIPAGFYTE